MYDARFEEMLTDYVEGVLAPAERAQVEAALARDPQLAAEVARIARVRALTTALPEERPPAELSDAVFRATTRRRRFLVRHLVPSFPWTKALAPVATTLLVFAAIAVAVVGYWQIMGHVEKTPMAMSQARPAAPAPAAATASAQPEPETTLEGKNEREETDKKNLARQALPPRPALKLTETAAKGTLNEVAPSEGAGYGSTVAGGLGSTAALGAKTSGARPAEGTGQGGDFAERLPDRFAADDGKTRDAGGGERREGPAKPLAVDRGLVEGERQVNKEASRGWFDKAKSAPASPAPPPPPERAQQADATAAIDEERGAEDIAEQPAAEEKKAETGAKILQRWEGRQSGINRAAVYIVVEPEKWRELWRLMHASLIEPPPAPEIDFSSHAVVGVFMGLKTTGGYATTVLEVRHEDGALTIVLQETQPQRGQAVTEALTQPYSVVTAPREIDGLRLEETTPVRLRRR